jgi:hypothetical protein
VRLVARIIPRIACGRPMFVDAAHRARRRRWIELELRLRRRQSVTAERELQHAMVKAEELNWRAETVARHSRLRQQLVTDVARQVRRDAFSEQRRDSQRIVAKHRIVDLLEIA